MGEADVAKICTDGQFSGDDFYEVHEGAHDDLAHGGGFKNNAAFGQQREFRAAVRGEDFVTRHVGG